MSYDALWRNFLKFPALFCWTSFQLRSFLSVSKYFAGDKWKVHPDWTYCEYLFDSIKNFETPEERIQHFLNLASGPGWKWRSIRPKLDKANHQKHASKPDKDSYYYCKKIKWYQTWIFFHSNLLLQIHVEDQVKLNDFLKFN